MAKRWIVRVAALSLIVGSMGAGPCVNKGPNFFDFLSPAEGLLTSPGSRSVSLMVPAYRDQASLVIRLDGADVTSAFTFAGRVGTATLAIGDGPHVLDATVTLSPAFLGTRQAEARFEAVTLHDPDVCEILNDAECLLPFPSSRYQTPNPDSLTGVFQDYPPGALPAIRVGGLGELIAGTTTPLDPARYNVHDGVSPTVQPMMHFPGGVDLEASDAPRLLEATRNFDLRALANDSPSVLIDAATGERIAHFLENDANATGANAARQATFLRPGKSLLPGHRYIVAIRNLVAPGGGAVEPEPAFRTLRDGAPTTIPQLEARRAHFEQQVFPVLESHGIPRANLVLAFDFTVASDEDLTGTMVWMRDEAFSWIASQPAASLFTVTSVTELSDCSGPEDLAWREVKGTFRVPNFLTSDEAGTPPPEADPIAQPNVVGVVARSEDGTPLITGFVDAPYGIALPCSAKLGPKSGVVLGHGLFGSGVDFPRDLVAGLEDFVPGLVAQGVIPPGTALDLIAAGTHWSGLSTLEVPPLPDEIPGSLEEILADPVLVQQLITLLESFIGQIFIDFDKFQGMPDRLQQGQLHALSLARMLDTGVFNAHPCFQRLAPEPADCRTATSNPSLGVIDTAAPTYYFGASLGGIMGLMFGALSPDVERVAVNVPAINFSFLLQRSFAFAPFGAFLGIFDLDPMQQALGLQVLHEIWVRGESAGYANHITGFPLAPIAGTNAKRVLLTPARHDSVVHPIGAQIAAATMGIENVEGSVEQDLPLVPDASSPRASGHVLYDTGGYVVGVHDDFIPPLANQPPADDGGGCNPHGRAAVIPAALLQLVDFLTPDGVVENFCNGLCDAAEPLEIPYGEAVPCTP